MLHLNKIAKSLDEKREILAASRREMEAMLEGLKSDAPLPIAALHFAANLDRRICASMSESIELYHILTIDPYVFVNQMRAVANLIHAQTRLAKEHQLIAWIVEQVRLNRFRCD